MDAAVRKNCFGCTMNTADQAEHYHMRPWGLCLEDPGTRIYRALPTALESASCSLSPTHPLYNVVLRAIVAKY